MKKATATGKAHSPAKKQQQQQQRPKKRRARSSRPTVVVANDIGYVGGRDPKLSKLLPLPPSTKVYGAILADPFLEAGVTDPPGIPTYPAFPSRKWRSAMKGTMLSGTASCAFVYINPYWTMSSDDNCGAYSSSAAFAGNTFTSAATGIALLTNAQNPYSSATLSASNNAIQSRLVACGIRLRYSGTELNRGGSFLPVFTRSDWSSLTTLTSGAVLTKYPFTEKCPVTEEWSGTVWFPTEITDLQYYNLSDISGYWQDYASLGVIVDAPVVGSTYEFEIVCYWEFQGPNVISLTTSSADQLGMSNVIEGVAQSRGGPEKAWLPSYVRGTMDAIRSTSEWMYSHPTMVAAATMGLSHLATGGAGARLLEL